MSSLPARSLLMLAGSAFAAVATPAQAQTSEIHPYIEVQQVLDADLETGDTLTYTNVMVGADGSYQTQRTQIQVSAQYTHTFGYDGGMSDSDIVTGIARGNTQIMPGLLNFEGGVMASRARADGRGLIAGNLFGSQENTTSVFSAFAGPRLQTNLGNIGLTAGYTFGYTRVQEERNRGVPASAPNLDLFDKSTSHSAYASLAQSPGRLPFGWVLSGNWEREDMDQLDERYEGKFARLDVTVPITRSLALVGGIGYENIEVSSRDAIRDGAGNPVLGPDGRYQTNSSSPRTIAYQTDGLIYDAGVMWKPTQRTSVEVRVGKRYNSTTYTGTASWQFSSSAGLAISLYDSIESFGRQTNETLSRIPTSFNVARGPFNNGYGGCVYGQGGKGGGCFNNRGGSIPSANFRARGVQALVSGGRGPVEWGIGGGYQRNTYLVPDFGIGFSLAGTFDQMWYVQGYHNYTFDNRSALGVNAYASWYDNGLAGAPTVFGAGGDVSYSYNFTNRFSASTSAGVYYSDSDQFGDSVTGSALIALRYGL